MEPATAPHLAANPMNAFADALTPKVAVSYLRVSTTGQARRGDLRCGRRAREVQSPRSSSARLDRPGGPL